MVGVIEEHGVLLQFLDKCIKGERADSKILAEMIGSAELQGSENMVKIRRSIG
jgi:hypothetical protein